MPPTGACRMPFHRRPARSDRAAEFDALLREHVPALYRSAYRWTGTVDRAEDLLQDLLVRLFPRLDELRGLDQIRPWAMRVMYRMFVDRLRRERSSPVQFEADLAVDEALEEKPEVADPAGEPPELVDRHLTQERIVSAWAELGEEHRMVLAMHDIEGYSLVEIAGIAAVPVGTMKSRLSRARARLRELLATERSAASNRVNIR